MNRGNQKISHLAKLTSKQVREIWKAHWLKKESQSSLAARFNVSQATICQLINGKIYRSITATLLKSKSA